MSHYKDSFSHSKPRFVESAVNVIDPLVDNRHFSHSSSVHPVVRFLSSQGSASLGNTVIYQLPTTGYVHSMAIANDFAQTGTADMIPYVGAACISRIVLRAGSETLHDYDYVDALNYLLKNVGNEESITRIMEAAGGSACDTTSAAIPNLMAMIPTAFSALLGCKPLILHKLSVRCELEVTYRTQAQCSLATATGGAISNSQLVLWMSESGDNLREAHQKEAIVHKSIDFRTFKSTAVSTGSETSLDLSGFPGLIKRLSVRCSLSSEIDSSTPINYFNNQVIDTVKTDVDGAEETVFQDARQGELTSIIYNQGKAQSSTLGYTYTVPLSLHTTESKITHKHNVGGLHSSKVNKFLLKVTHSLGANAEVGITAIIAALFQYKNGQLKRLL